MEGKSVGQGAERESAVGEQGGLQRGVFLALALHLERGRNVAEAGSGEPCYQGGEGNSQGGEEIGRGGGEIGQGEGAKPRANSIRTKKKRFIKKME